MGNSESEIHLYDILSFHISETKGQAITIIKEFITVYWARHLTCIISFILQTSSLIHIITHILQVIKIEVQEITWLEKNKEKVSGSQD